MDLTLTGPLHPGILARSMAAAVRRQWSLRTALHDHGQQIRQVVVDPSAAPGLEIYDLRGGGRREQIVKIVRDLYTRPFDLERGRMLVAGLLRLDDHHHRLVISMDHLIRDLRSDGILIGGLLAIYSALLADPSRDPDAVLAPLQHQYVDWADQQWRLLDDGYDAALRQYWTTRLAGAPDVELPVDHPTHEEVSVASICGTSMSPSALARASTLVAAPDAASRRDRALAYLCARPIALLASLFELLHRVTGQSDLCVVMPTPARPSAMLSVMGHFVIPLIVRVQVTDGLSFRDLFQRVMAAYQEAQRWGRVPLYAAMQPPRGLLKVAFNYHRRRLPVWPPGLELAASTDRHPSEAYVDLDLIYALVDTGSTINVTLLSRAEAFEPETARKLLHGFVGLANELFGSPDGRLADARIPAD